MNKLKQWALAGMLSLAGALGIGSYVASRPVRDKRYTLEQLTEANARLREFPEQIAGAKEIKKYETPRAKYTLAHVRQEHEVYDDELETNGMSKRAKERVCNVQKNIYLILDELVGREICDSVYPEGLYPELNERIQKIGLGNVVKYNNPILEDRISELNSRLNRGILYEGEEERLRKELGETSDKLKDEQEKYKFLAGAAYLMASEGKIKLIPAETREGQNRAEAEILSTGRPGRDSYSLREDILLDIVSKQSMPLALTVYGAGHDFKDNVERWNRENPDRKYSLIEITSEGLE